MPQNTSTFLMRGGLDLVSPPIAVPNGRAIAALNYEPEIAGYKRMVGFERYDGQTSPSSGANPTAVAALRALISTVPGSGAVRGVCVYDGAVWAFRDTSLGEGAMYKATSTGWALQTFDSHIVYFSAGTAAFVEGEVLVGGTSTATATIKRIVLQAGTFSGGTAVGYLIVTNITGTFQGETGTSSSGSATIQPSTAVTLSPGGRYDFVVHNFYGATKRLRMYFCNGAGNAYEWDGEVLAPIFSGNTSGPLDEITILFNRGGDTIITRDGNTVVLRGDNDMPTHIGQFSNHLFLGFPAGSVIHSGIGEPLDYRASAGAGELSFGEPPTGFLTAARTALVIVGSRHIEYLVGTSSSDFVMKPISDGAGAIEWTIQTGGDQPVYLDQSGLRYLNTTSAFGDWRLGTLTQLVQPFFDQRRAAGAVPTASLVMKAKDQYYITYDDGFGLIIFLGRKVPEVLPFLLPVTVNCAGAGVMSEAEGERYFVGCEDGYVYELNKGTSFDGSAVQAYIRLPWNTVDAPSQQKRFHKVTVEVDAPDACSIGVVFDVDYNRGYNPGGAEQAVSVAQGSASLIPVADYDAIDWTAPAQGILEAYLDGIGTNCAVMLVSEHTNEAPHTLTAATVNVSPRRLLR